MGLAADRSGIQFRLLNRRKGPAVQGPRTQSDRDLYKQAVRGILSKQENLEVREGEVVSFRLAGSRVTGVCLADGTEIVADATILTTGTFLGGVIHIGEESRSGGRIGDAASSKLALQLREWVPNIGRLKTGTPPRLASNSIDWASLEMQDADPEPVLFSFMSAKPTARQIACGITHTNSATHEIIRMKTSVVRPCMAGVSKESGHGIAPRSRIRSHASLTRIATRSSLNPKGLQATWSIPTESRRRCLRKFRWTTSTPSLAWNRRRSCNPVTRLNMIMSIRSACRRHLRSRALTGFTLQVRSMGPLATKKQQRKVWSPD